MKPDFKPKHGKVSRGHEQGGIKGSRKGIKHGHSGRHISETEHDDRMDYQRGDHPAFPQGE